MVGQESETASRQIRRLDKSKPEPDFRSKNCGHFHCWPRPWVGGGLGDIKLLHTLRSQSSLYSPPEKVVRVNKATAVKVFKAIERVKVRSDSEF